MTRLRYQKYGTTIMLIPMVALKKLLKPLIYRGAQSSFQAPLRALGFTFERRRRGELGISLWKLKTKRSKKSLELPKRFVFIPGFGDSPVAWLGVFSLLLPKLKREYDEIIFLDFPGFGGFYYNDPAFSDIDSFFDHAFQILDQLQPHTLMGHSLGAWVSSSYCVSFSKNKRPERAKKPEKLLVLSPPGAMNTDECGIEWKSRFELALDGKYEDFIVHMFAKAPWIAKKSAKRLDWFFKKPEIRAFMESIRHDHLHKEELSSLPEKTFLLWGDQDEINFYRWHSEWTTHAPKTLKLITFPGVGHMIHMETPLRVAYMVAQILGSTEKELESVQLLSRLMIRVG